MKRETIFATVPMQLIGPIKITGPIVNDDVMVPLATYETPLWPSTHRGAKVSMHADGIQAVIVDERMSRSVLLEAPNAIQAHQRVTEIMTRKPEMAQVAARTSQYARWMDCHYQIVANLIYLRFELTTGDASGHNMVTKAAEHVMQWILQQYPDLRYISVSGNYCSDKKATAVNGILGRGKYVVTELVVPRKICNRFLKTTPEKIVEINIKKNLLGTAVAGGLRTANAHFANMLLGFYLATGQDAANIIEGSQGFVHAEVRSKDLYFSVTLPSLIVGTVGSGKDLPFVRKNLTRMGCLEPRAAGENARRLAAIAAATVLCGELSLLAALTNPGELMQAHEKYERK